MTIEELLAATGLTANDLVPIYDAEAAQSVEPTQKITAAQFAAAVKVLASLVNTTEMNAAIQQSTATVHSVNVNGTSIVAYRVGNTVFFSCVGGTYECPSAGSYVRVAGSSTPLSQLPVGYRPVGYVDIRDSLAQKRLVMAPSSDASTGRFTGAEAFTSAALRFSATWVTTDQMPT